MNSSESQDLQLCKNPLSGGFLFFRSNTPKECFLFDKNYKNDIVFIELIFKNKEK